MPATVVRYAALLVAAVVLGIVLGSAWRGRSRLRVTGDHLWLLQAAEAAQTAQTAQTAEAAQAAAAEPVVQAMQEAQAEQAMQESTADQATAEPVPKVLHQTYIARARVPAKVWANVAAFAPEYEHRFYDDEAAEAFLRAHFSERVLAAFRGFKHGAHKADLFRYAVLYICGGVYMDIKTQLVQRIDGLFPAGAVTSVISRKPVEIYQGIVAAPPRQPIFLALMDAAVRSGAAAPYNRFIRDFMAYVRADVGGGGARPDTLLRGARHTYQLYSERCDQDASRCEDGLDRYGWCCSVESEGKRIIKTRYADFPW